MCQARPAAVARCILLSAPRHSSRRASHRAEVSLEGWSLCFTKTPHLLVASEYTSSGVGQWSSTEHRGIEA